jgi:hypothetical protein
LPAKVTTQVMEVTKDSKEIAFPIVAANDSPAGKHGGIFAQVVIDKGGELITANTGGTELRIDVPLPPKAVATPAANPMTPKPPAPMGQPEKRLTRLEKLRLEQEEREKAAAGGTPAPKKEEPKKEEPKKP